MADNSQKCSGVLDVAYDTVVLGFNLVGDEVPNLPARLAQAVQSTEVQNALKKALEDVAEKYLKDQSATTTNKEAEDFVRSIATTGATAAGQNVLEQIKRTPKFQQLEKRAQDVLTALKCSPVGVWYDKNEKWVYIVGAGAALAGAVAMYLTRSGDTVTDPAMSVIKDKPLKFKPFGSLEISGQLTKFVPSKQEVGVKVFVTTKWEKVEAKFSLSAQATGSDITATGTSQVIIPLGHGVVSTFEGTIDPRQRTYSLGMGVDFTSQKVRLNLLANIKDNKLSSGSVDLSARGVFKPLNLNPGITGKIDGQTGGYSILGTISGTF